MKHKQCLLQRRRELPHGIYVDEAYPKAIQQRRAVLHSVLKLTQRIPEYKGKCKLERDHLVIKGSKYSIENLNKLPEDLTPYKASQCTTDSCLISHGQHTPLSNYHPSPFEIEGHKFHSAEQFIQFKKACHFNDYITADKIKACKHAGDAKTFKLYHAKLQ